MVIKKEIDFRVIIDNIDQPIYIVDPETYRILYANKIIQEIYQEHLVGKFCYKALQGLGSPCEFCTNDKLFGEDPISPHLWDYYNKKIDKLFHYFVYAIDWDEGRVQKERLAILGKLAGGVGHELSNPPATITNAAYFLNMVLEDLDPQVRESLQVNIFTNSSISLGGSSFKFKK